MACKHGKLKHPRGRRVCKKVSRRGGRGGCKHGRLKHPRGRRHCKKR